MPEIYLSPIVINSFAAHLQTEEKSPHTITKYLLDIKTLAWFAGSRPLTKSLTVAFKKSLVDSGKYEVSSINTILASIISLCRFLGHPDCAVKTLRTQRKVYCPEERELTKSEYLRLLDASKRHPRLCLIIQTICSTGIRVSELEYFTVEAVRRGEVVVNCNNKTRTILVPSLLKSKLLSYIKSKKIESGVIFRTRSGRPLNRSNIWADMKKLCHTANVNPSKAFPHNLRKLFARTFYSIDKDIAKLADILGHSSINTTRIYIMTTGSEHRRQIERLHLLI